MNKTNQTKKSLSEDENKKLWVIDFIIPLSSFDLTDPEQQKLAFHYTNLRPRWIEDIKSAKLRRG